jgi:hypothetical protein
MVRAHGNGRLASVADNVANERTHGPSDRSALQRAAKGTLIACLLGLLILGPGLGSAQADELYGFVQSTCVPEIGYFSIRRFQLVNLPHEHPYAFPLSRTPEALSRLSALGARYGIYDSGLLQSRPLECDLPVNVPPRSGTGGRPVVKVRVVGVYDDNNGQATSERQIKDYVDVFAGSALVGRLFLNSYGFAAYGTDLIEIAGNGLRLEANLCSRPIATAQQANVGCISRDLRSDAP